MNIERHLLLQEKLLAPSLEWQPASLGWLVLRIAEGQGYWLQNGSAARPVNVGDVLVIGGSGDGVLRASQLGPLRWHFFTVQPRSLSGIFTIAEGHRFEAPQKNSTRHVLAYSAGEPIGIKFAALAGQPGECLSSRCACLQLWAESIASVLAEKPAAVPGDDNLRERFRQMIGQIPESELASHSLAGLAAQLHCSERHFSRLFREEFGISLRSRQIELRLQRARQLLVHSNAKIIHVAYESGYHHLGLFNAMFKKRFEVTPSEWRRQNVPKSPSPRPHAAVNHGARMAGRLGMIGIIVSLGGGLLANLA